MEAAQVKQEPPVIGPKDFSTRLPICERNSYPGIIISARQRIVCFLLCHWQQHLLVLFNSFVSFIQEPGDLMRFIYCWDRAADLHLSLCLCLSLPANCRNKSSTVLKAIDSEMVWSNYQSGWLRILPGKKEKRRDKINKGSEARLSCHLQQAL